MSTRSLREIGLKPAQIKKVERLAVARGQSADDLVRSIIARELLSDQPFDELFKPVRADVKRQRITPRQLDQIVSRARISPRKGAARRRERQT
jgi:hypothetical protein